VESLIVTQEGLWRLLKMLSKKSIKVIKDIHNYIDNEWVIMDGTFWDWSDEFKEGFKKAYEDVNKANKTNFLKIKYLLTGLDKEVK